MTRVLSAEELLAGGSITHELTVPPHLLPPAPPNAGAARDPEADGVRHVVIRPLLARDVERISRAAKEQRVLASVLMVQQALVSPKLTVEQVAELPAGLLQFLVERVNLTSGLSLGESELEQAVRQPLAKACFILAREFGWTPATCSELTVGQILLYLEMLARDERPEGPPK